MTVVVVDYGMGNVHSLIGALNYLNVHSAIISNQEKDIVSASKLILPGVGAFNHAMYNIRLANLDQYLTAAIVDKKIPVLGICLGMQLMGMASTENGICSGLAYIEGEVTVLDNKNLKIPHVGFNQVLANSNSQLFYNVDNLSDFYFSHSYKMECDIDINQSFCEYGVKFIASYEKDNIAGVQFHPELSQRNGLKILKNFLERF